jgi:hypothetical protein
LNPQAGGEHAADQHGEHHRVAHLVAWVEFAQRIDHRPPHDGPRGVASTSFQLLSRLGKKF